MKLKLQIKNRFTGSLIFEYESEKNTIKETVLEAIKAGANLYGANLYGANLRDADLSDANLYGANLRGANLYGANLYGANLYGANLRDANLRGANLRDANLRGANLRDANLRGANLYGANLYGANLYGANLRGANLRDANLSDADLSDANLSDANLRGANLRGANLSDANLYGAKEIPAIAIAQTRVCADGDIIGYKKCLNGIIVKLLIPKEAKRNNAFGRKCRAEYAQVLEIIGADKAISQHDNSFTYNVGDIVRPTEPFDKDFTNECSTGIHFFITLEEAKNY